MDNLAEDELILKAAIEFGPDYIYTIRNGTLGPTLYVDAGPKEDSAEARKAIPPQWEGLYVVVLCTGPRRVEERDSIKNLVERKKDYE